MGSANVGGGGGEAAVVKMCVGGGSISGGVERTVDGQACAASAPAFSWGVWCLGNAGLA